MSSYKSKKAKTFKVNASRAKHDGTKHEPPLQAYNIDHWFAHRRGNVRDITKHEQDITDMLQAKRISTGNDDIPESVSDPKISKARPKKVQWFREPFGYNPADYYSDKQMMTMKLANEKGMVPLQSCLFFCNLCEKEIWDGKLAFTCRVKTCKRMYCKHCYPFEHMMPECVVCKHTFCAVCDKRNKCYGCNKLVCQKCIVRHYQAGPHKCANLCCVHTYPYDKSVFADDSDDNHKKMSPEEMKNKRAQIKRLRESSTSY